MIRETVHLACAADERYAPWCATMLHSALERSAPRSLVVHFLHPEPLSAATLGQLDDVVRRGGGTFSPLPVADESIVGLPRTGPFPGVVWYRTLLPDLRPELDRVLYLDSDTLVVDGLLPLWDTDLEGGYVAAVQNLIEARLADRPQQVGIPAGQPYFNSGVLLMDLDAMRRDDCVRRIHEHAREHEGRSIWPDQDALNFVLGARCSIQHPRWNCQNSFFYWDHAAEELGEAELAEAIETPAILHFEGPPATKPWHYLNRHPWRSTYWEHLRATPFGAIRPEGRSLENRLVRYLPDSTVDGIRKARRRLRSIGGGR